MRYPKLPLIACSLLAIVCAALVFRWTPKPEVNQPRHSALAAVGPAIPARGAPVPNNSADPFAGFDQWVDAWQSASARERPELLAAGVTIATERRTILREAIQLDPEAALAAAVPLQTRRDLPAEVLELLETPFSAAGAYEVIVTCSFSEERRAEEHVDSIERFFTLGAQRLQAFTFGPRLATGSKHSLPAFGIHLDGMAALAADPIRVLTPGESLARGLDPAFGIWTEFAGQTAAFPSLEALEAKSQQLQAAEQALGPFSIQSVDLSAQGAETVAAEPWTAGPKSLLYIRARFSNEPTSFQPISQQQAQSDMDRTAEFLRQASYGKLTLSSTFTTVVALPNAASTYTNNFAGLMADAAAAAKSANASWDVAGFDQFLVVTSNASGFSYSGKANFGQGGSHLVASSDTVSVAAHELGHNLGLWHANGWHTDAIFPTGRDRIGGGYVGDGIDAEWLEYGHRHSIMGEGVVDPGSRYRPHPAAREKFHLGWLGQEDVAFVSQSSTVRLYAQDHLDAVGTRAIRIDRPSTDYTGRNRKYWLSSRRQYDDFHAYNPFTHYGPHGVQLDWAADQYDTRGVILLDTTPFSQPLYGHGMIDPLNPNRNDKADGVILLGRTYSDLAAGIHITPIARGGVPPDQWFDVRIVLGPQPGNRPPAITLQSSALSASVNQPITFTAAASDPDGDEIYYSWDWDRPAFPDQLESGLGIEPSALNSPTASKSWSQPGKYTVRVTASDGRGGLGEAKVVVTVGSPANSGEVWGRLLWGGRPVAGARVHVTEVTNEGFFVSELQTWTLSDGSYALSGLPAKAHSITVKADGLTLQPQFASPISVSSTPLFGYDFHAAEAYRPIDPTSVIVSGRVTQIGPGLTGVKVTAGGQTVTTTNGRYEFRLPPGNYVIEPTSPIAFSPSSRAIEVTDVDLDGQDFAVSTRTVTGMISGVPTNENAPGVRSSLGNLSIATLSEGVWRYSIEVPLGDWYLSPGYRNTHQGTSVRLNVAEGDAPLTQDFTLTAAGYDVFRIPGRVTEYGVGIPGIAVSTGTVTLLTDSAGNYDFNYLPRGTYTITPSAPGYTFTPPSQVATIGDRISTVPTFIATGPNQRPALVGSPTASPASASPGQPVALSALASDDGGEGNLSYFWTVVSGPGPATFSPNRSNAAKHSTATFTTPGVYVVEVTVTDAAGASTTGQTQVILPGEPVITVSPYETAGESGGSFQFVATAWDAAGNKLPAQVSWSATLGWINSAGLHLANEGSGRSVVTATGPSGQLAKATLFVSPGAPVSPRIFEQPRSAPLVAGKQPVISVRVAGIGPFGYQWFRNGQPIDGATGPELLLPAGAGSAGRYQAAVTTPEGIISSETATLFEPTGSSSLVNLSSRALAVAGEGSLIAGFVIDGAEPVRILVRAAGPALVPFGLDGMPQPVLKLFRGDALLAEQGGWNAPGVAESAARVGAFPFASGSADAALLIDLEPGAYTAVIADAANRPGIALAEVYADPRDGSSAYPVNISSRAALAAGDGILIAGFVVGGAEPGQVLARAVGPGLVPFGVTGALGNPRLQLFRGSAEIAFNDDWGLSADAPQIMAAAARVGAFPLDPASGDSALLRYLEPGAYTLHVRGGEGVALIEVYEVKD
jgi:hypothetical protein